MEGNTTIVICYQAGTADMLDTCLSSIARHTSRHHRVIVLTRDECESELSPLRTKHGFSGFFLDVGVPEGCSSKVHGMMLDKFLPDGVADGFVVTLDSDCFPVADGWLDDLIGILDNGCRIAGILHPWAPPPEDMPKSKIEWRVRSQHCWESTHVACQILRVEDLKELGQKYNAGDDTGLAIVAEARKRGWKIGGFKPTRCPKPINGPNVIDPEFNRYVAIIYGDKVYHHGGYTRVATFGDAPMLERSFKWAMDRVVEERGAEFLLHGAYSYQFKFDREEVVAVEKMQRLFGLQSQTMKG